jgi:hypothetical protein
MVADMVIIVVDMVATSHMVTEEATVATSHTAVVVAGATKVATKGATRLVAIEVVPREDSPMIELSSLATSASIAKSLMLAMSLEEKDLALSELECSKTRMESSRGLPSLNLITKKMQIERVDLMELLWVDLTEDSE